MQLGFTFRRLYSLSPSFTITRLNNQDIETTYTYSDTSIIATKRTETINYETSTNTPYGRLAKEESWGEGFYSIANFYQNSNIQVIRQGLNYRLQLTDGVWESANSDIIYARDSSTKPPQTTYRKPFNATERQINVKLRAKPFAGDSLKERSRPVEVDFLVSEAQATDYGNVFLALLYGRKQSFTFATAINDNLLANLKPLTRIDVTWYGVVYQCLVDGISWAHTLTEMVIGMRLIPLRTALAVTPSVTSNLVIASPMIEVSIYQQFTGSISYVIDQYLGGSIYQEFTGSITYVNQLVIEVSIYQEFTGSITYS